ncbi:L-asparagine transporter-like permease [Pseudarthrobacter sulfonivorans]|nr:L-asparagine transporter-like permease [Pseudarthrobacter sulfonivorans]
MKSAVRTVLWRILVLYIGSIFVIAAVVPMGSAGLKSPFAAVLDAAGMPGAATAITLVAVIALLSALNANLCGASRMAFSLAERGEAPRLLASVSTARVPGVAVLASVAFGVVAVVLELAFPEKVLPVLLNIVGSTCLLVCTSALLAQLALRLRTDRDGTELPLRMPGFPRLTVFGLVILAAIFTVGLIGEDSRPQLLSTFGLVTLLAVANWLHHRKREAATHVEFRSLTSSQCVSTESGGVNQLEGSRHTEWRVRVWPARLFAVHERWRQWGLRGSLSPPTPPAGRHLYRQGHRQRPNRRG